MFFCTVCKGNSHNLLKVSAKRRRSKETIKEEKRLEAQRQREITAKLDRIAQLEQQVLAHRTSADKVVSLESDFMRLLDSGLLKQDAQGNVHCVESWEEHQQIL